MAIIDRQESEEPTYFSQQVRAARRFFRPVDKGNPPASDFRIVSGGAETCIPGYEVNRTDFPYWAVELVTSGRGSAELSGRSYDLIPGAICAYGPGIPHRIIADHGVSMEKHFVDVVPVGRENTDSKAAVAGGKASENESPPLPTGFSFLANHLAGRVTYCSAPESLRRTFEELSEYGRIRTPGAARVAASLFDVLLLKIAETAGKQGLAESAAYVAYRRCRTIIDERFPELATAAEVAEAASVDVSYLCRLFRRFDAETAYGRLTRLRMDHAAGLMIREGLSVKQAASELGYEDPFTFSRRFKKVMGVAPRDFVENHSR